MTIKEQGARRAEFAVQYIRKLDSAFHRRQQMLATANAEYNREKKIALSEYMNEIKNLRTCTVLDPEEKRS